APVVPSWPSVLAPQHHAAPSRSSRQECCPPATVRAAPANVADAAPSVASASRVVTGGLGAGVTGAVTESPAAGVCRTVVDDAPTTPASGVAAARVSGRDGCDGSGRSEE